MKKLVVLALACLAWTSVQTVRAEDEVVRENFSAMEMRDANPPGGCWVEKVYFQQYVHDGNRIQAIIPGGFVQDVQVRWNDDSGSKTNARGEVRIDGYSLGTRDIKADGNVSYFHAGFPTQNRWQARLTIIIRRDDAYVNWAMVRICR